ncbi:NGP1NT-domain-containing protein [Thozetella sp. PMI_491]|nr:NGP1NT-domain-containing protein [Thozetella sp. PMI_491]
MANVKVKGTNFYTTEKKAKLKKTLKDTGAPTRNKDGKIVSAAVYQSREVPTAVIEPNRRWFNSTRVISQEALSNFREAMAEKDRDPNTVLLKSNKLPLSLIRDGDESRGASKRRTKMTIETSPFAETFGPKAQRKRVKLGAASIEELAGESEKNLDSYRDRLEQKRLLSGTAGAANDEQGSGQEDEGAINAALEPIFNKGQSRRIWNELYKVIDSVDIVLHVLDARDPLGTRCRSVEKYLRTEAPHKHHVFILNKIDLVPTKVAAAWVKTLQKEYPTCALRSSVKNPFGRGSLIDLLRQFSILHKERKQVSVGLIGYPNVGKSSVINSLRGKPVARVAPIPGETKVWQYVTLTKRIYLVDCPGIVPPNNDSPEDILLRGVVRVENVQDPAQYLAALMAKVKPQHMERTYELKGWKDSVEFLELLARKSGRLLKGGEPDVDAVAKAVINDFIRGKLPWFTPPPILEGDGAVRDGREGRLGEMRKRKRDDLESVLASAPGTSMGASTPPSGEAAEEPEDDDFEGFSSEGETREGTEVADKQSTPASSAGEEDMIPLDDSSEEEDDDAASENGVDGLLEESADPDESEEELDSVPCRKRQKKAR